MPRRQGRRGVRPGDSAQDLPSRGQPKSHRGSPASSRGLERTQRSVTETAKWREAFDLLPSISRSGGNDGEGDTYVDMIPCIDECTESIVSG